MELSGLPEHGSDKIPYDDVDLKQYALILWKWRGVIAGVTVGAMLVSGLLSFFVLRPVYEASVYLRTVQGDLNDFPPAQIIGTQYFMAGVISSMGLAGQYSSRDLMTSVTVRQVPDTRMTQIVVEHSDPSLASRLANGIAAEFVDELKRASQEAIKQASAGTQQALAKAEEDLNQAYKSGVSLETRLARSEAEVTELRERIASLKTSLSDAELRRVELSKGLQELEAALARTPKSVPGPPDWQGRPSEVPNETYQRLEEQLVLGRTELAQVGARIDQLKAIIPDLERELAQKTVELASVTVEKDALDRKIKSLDKIARDLSQKMAEYQASAPVVSIAAPAMVPDRPVKPRKLLNVALAGALGFFASVLWALAFESWAGPSKSLERGSKSVVV